MWRIISNLRSLLPLRRLREGAPLVPVVRLNGAIGAAGGFGGGLSMAGLARNLETAFNIRGIKAVALAVNSPGGSPVQSNLIFTRIRALAEENEVPVFAFAEDVAASGGYWLACAADEIYADDSSVIGSIGVISAGFGFQNAIKKLGVERRVHTAGEMKSTLDPFLRENPDDVERLIELQQDVFDAFKEMVRERRKDKLTASEDEVFTGAFWTGRRALEMGLIDGLGDLTSVMQERYGDKVRFRPVEQRQNWFKQKLGLGSAVRNWPSSKGTVSSIVDDVLVAIEERGLWHKFGL